MTKKSTSLNTKHMKQVYTPIKWLNLYTNDNKFESIIPGSTRERAARRPTASGTQRANITSSVGRDGGVQRARESSRASSRRTGCRNTKGFNLKYYAWRVSSYLRTEYDTRFVVIRRIWCTLFVSRPSFAIGTRLLVAKRFSLRDRFPVQNM